MNDQEYQDTCNQGAKAFSDGVPEYECPYVEGSFEEEAWSTGWYGWRAHTEAHAEEEDAST
jgi:hypothetical protein